MKSQVLKRYVIVIIISGTELCQLVCSCAHLLSLSLEHPSSLFIRIHSIVHVVRMHVRTYSSVAPRSENAGRSLKEDLKTALAQSSKRERERSRVKVKVKCISALI